MGCILSLQMIFSVISSSSFASWWPKLVYYPPQRLRDGVLSPSMFTFQRDRSHVLEKDFSWVVNLQEAGKRFSSQRGKERTYNGKFSKVNALSRKREGRKGSIVRRKHVYTHIYKFLHVSDVMTGTFTLRYFS